MEQTELQVALRIKRPWGNRFLFVSSNDLRLELQSRGYRGDHPNRLELDATIACLTFFENVRRNVPHSTSKKLIQNDNWNVTYSSMVHLFGIGRGYIQELDEPEQFQVFDLADDLEKPEYWVSDLEMAILEHDCGKTYSTSSGEILLEHVDRI